MSIRTSGRRARTLSRSVSALSRGHLCCGLVLPPDRKAPRVLEAEGTVRLTVWLDSFEDRVRDCFLPGLPYHVHARAAAHQGAQRNFLSRIEEGSCCVGDDLHVEADALDQITESTGLGKRERTGCVRRGRWHQGSQRNQV